MKLFKTLGLALATMAIFFSYGCTSDDVPPPPANTVWIDVRTAEEFAGGHVDQALNIPYEEIVAGVKAEGLAKDTPIYLYCRSGRRAEAAKQALLEDSYTHVFNVGSLGKAKKLLAQGDGEGS